MRIELILRRGAIKDGEVLDQALYAITDPVRKAG